MKEKEKKGKVWKGEKKVKERKWKKGNESKRK